MCYRHARLRTFRRYRCQHVTSLIGGPCPCGRILLPQSQQPIENWLCEAGNSVAGWADGLGNVSGKLELAGLGIAGVGFVTAQPEITAPGLALAATGGVGNIGAGVLQFGAGLLQGAGGGGFSNSGYAALSLATGFTLARGVAGAAASGYRTASQRTVMRSAMGRQLLLAVLTTSGRASSTLQRQGR